MIRLFGALLIAAGITALAVSSFSYTKTKHEVDLGPIQVDVKEKEKVTIAPALSVVAILAGGGMIILGGRLRRA